MTKANLHAIILSEVRGTGPNKKNNERGNEQMTKVEMLNYIEKTGMVIDFDAKYLMRQTKDRITRLYNQAVQYAKRYNLEIS